MSYLALLDADSGFSSRFVQKSLCAIAAYFLRSTSKSCSARVLWPFLVFRFPIAFMTKNGMDFNIAEFRCLP